MILDERTIARCVEEFNTCIECEQKFFHKRFCTHGIMLDAEQLIKKLEARAKLLLKETFSCRCGQPAMGTAWVAYHNEVAILSAIPVCFDHAYFEEDRPHGFLNNIVTKDTQTIQKHLRN